MTIRYTGAVDETGASAQRLAGEIKQIFAELQVRAKAICGEAWQASAAEAFEHAQRRWDAEANNLANAQSDIGRLTQRSMQNAMAADTKGAGLF